MTRILGVIPSRFAAVRLPGKPLLRDTGKFMVQHVWEQARRARRLAKLVIATDDERIRDAARDFGAEVVMTSPDHPNGTSRCAEAASKVRCDAVVNIQGDEPDIDPEFIDRTAALLSRSDMTTVATPQLPDEEAANPARVKVVLDRRGWALYFSRSRIPSSGPCLLHVGVYGYKVPFLRRIAKMPASPLQEAERLEQLKVLESGARILVGVVDKPNPGGIDTPVDYARFVARWKHATARKKSCP